MAPPSGCPDRASRCPPLGNDLDFIREAMQLDKFRVMAERAAPWAHIWSHRCDVDGEVALLPLAGNSALTSNTADS